MTDTTPHWVEDLKAGDKLACHSSTTYGAPYAIYTYVRATATQLVLKNAHDGEERVRKDGMRLMGKRGYGPVVAPLTDDMRDANRHWKLVRDVSMLKEHDLKKCRIGTLQLVLKEVQG